MTKIKFNLWQNSETQMVTNLKTQNCDKNQAFKLWQLNLLQLKMLLNSKTQNVTKLNDTNVTIKIVTKLITQILIEPKKVKRCQCI